MLRLVFRADVRPSSCPFHFLTVTSRLSLSLCTVVKTNPAIGYPIIHHATIPHVTSPTNSPRLARLRVTALPRPTVCLITPSNTHIVVCTPGKVPSFPGLLFVLRHKPKIQQFHSHTSPRFSLSLSVAGIPVTSLSAAPLPKRPQASGRRVSTHLYPLACLLVPVI